MSLEAINYKFLDAMYTYLATVGHEEPFWDNHTANLIEGRYKRIEIKSPVHLEYIRLCFDLNPDLLNCCWLDEDEDHTLNMKLVVKQSLANYQQQQKMAAQKQQPAASVPSDVATKA